MKNLMKMPLLLLSIMLGLATGSYAQKASRDKVIKLLKTSGTEETIQKTMQLSIGNFKNMPGADSVPNDFWENFMKEIDYSELTNMYIPIYQEQFTDSDIDALIKFYESPIGKKFVEKTPIITSESMKAGQEWGMNLGMKIMQKMQEKDK